jgi:broad specificity phosphatase PhoE
MLTLYLVRHGQTAYNATGRVQGWLDVPLDDVGIAQALSVGRRFGSKRISAVYTSPLSRAAETAKAIAAACNREVVLDIRLREYNMGDWTGLTGDEIAATSPGYHLATHEAQIPNGESALDMRKRVESFLADVVAGHTSRDTLVAVSHGGTLGMVVAVMLNMPAVRRQPFTFGNTAITKVTYEHGVWRLRSLNDRCHLHSD